MRSPLKAVKQKRMQKDERKQLKQLQNQVIHQMEQNSKVLKEQMKDVLEGLK